MTDSLLHVENVTVRFGGLVALDNVSVNVARGAIHAVIGPNGAGKSTLLNVITGLYRPNEGDVVFDGVSVVGHAPHRITRSGVARTFQNTELFGQMTVLENVLVALDERRACTVVSAMLHDRRWKTSEVDGRKAARELLALVDLLDDEDTAAEALPFGKQRRLEIARALATEPKLLLLDEPAAGLRAAEIEALNRVLLNLRTERGLTILVIDHVMALVMAISDRISVLNFGRKIAEGLPAEVRGSAEVIEAYLGTKAAHAFGA